MKQQIFVVTPEKLVYVLKQAPEFAIGVGLLIYDEGHQFDTGSRGVTFELLLTALKSIVSQAQTVLISAVLSNANAISEWLNPNGAELVSGLGLAPNFRSIAFSSWTGDVGQLHFVNEKRPSIEEYLVPRVIEPINLGRKKRAKSDTLFPEKANLNTVSLFLGLKLAANGSVALFCGTKITASALCKKAVEMYGRSLPMSSPAEHSNQEEIRKLTLLHEKNLGANENMTLASNYGIFSHHNNVPYGIRLSIEHSMREGMIKFVLCTSTLSQGVNLPIRYLIVSGIQQGSEGMKTRDFHNLIGRAGRSGIHTEGSVIFGNPDVYDGRKNRETNWRWSQAINLLSPDSNEPCKSHLLTILDNFFNINTKQNIPDFDALEFCEQYINGVPLTVTIPERIASTQAELLIIRSSIQEQVKSKLQILASIESYLMSYAVEGTLDTQSDVSQLASSTLAYHLAREDDKPKLIKLFELLESNIKSTAPTYVRRRVFGKTLFGLQKSVEIEQWVDENTASLNSSLTIVELLNLTWPIVESSINAKIFNNLNRKEEIKAFALLWIQGYPYHILLARLRDAGVEYKHGATTRKLTIEQVIDLCQNALAYEGSLVIGAICSILGYLTSDQNPTVSLLKALQKNIQYGLPNKAATIFYELGFSDRVLAQELSMIAGSIQSRNEAIDGMILASEEYKQAIITYPSYFGYTLLDCLNKDVLS